MDSQFERILKLAVKFQWGISEVRSITTNQRVETINAVKTPGAIPNQAITNGTNNGKTSAPARGVIATNQRNILFSRQVLDQNHSS